MAAEIDRNAVRDELRALDERLAKLRAELEGLREEMRDYDDSPTATSLLLEQEALIEALEGRRAELLEQLGEIDRGVHAVARSTCSAWVRCSAP